MIELHARIFVTVTLLALCAGRAQGADVENTPQAEAGASPVSSLEDTQWRLVEFQSMDDATGPVRPSDPSAYTMHLNRDGTVTMRLNCNRASGSWFAEPGSDGASGRFLIRHARGDACSVPAPEHG